MYGQLGDIVFEKLFGFTDYSKSGSAGYAEHKPLVGKPLLQPVGAALNQLSISMRLHAAFCTPGEELARLKRYMNDNEILKLKTGLEVEDGNYVITDISETVEDCDKSGTPISYVVNLSLKEYVIPDKVQADQTKNQDNAAAVGDKKPVANKKRNPTTCAKEISKLVISIENHSKEINRVVEQQGGPSPIDNRAIIMNNALEIRNNCTKIIANTAEEGNCIHNDDTIKTSAERVDKDADVLHFNVKAGTPFATTSNARALSASVAKLKAAAQTIIKQGITGK